jgi:hypothetical protein
MALCVPQSETSGFQPLGTCPHAKCVELRLLEHSMMATRVALLLR